MILVLSLLVTIHEHRRQKKKREVCWQCKGYPRWREMLFEDDSSGDAQEEQSNEVNGFVTKKRHSPAFSYRHVLFFSDCCGQDFERICVPIPVWSRWRLSNQRGDGRQRQKFHRWTNRLTRSLHCQEDKERPRPWKGMLFEDDSYIRRPRTTRPWGRSQRRERRNASETNEKSDEH